MDLVMFMLDPQKQKHRREEMKEIYIYENRALLFSHSATAYRWQCWLAGFCLLFSDAKMYEIKGKCVFHGVSYICS